MGAGRTRFMRGPSFTYASVTNSLSTSTSLERFSALAIADRRTFSTEGAMRLLVVRKILIASPALWPRIRSTTSRAFWGDVRMYRASALASMADPLCSRCGLGRLFGRCLGGVSFKDARGRKLAQLVSHHVLGDVHRNEFPAVVHGQSVADKLRQNSGAARPRPHHFLLVPVVHAGHLLHQVVIDERSFS